MDGMLTLPRMPRNLWISKSDSEDSAFIFIYNPIHKLIKLQFKVCCVPDPTACT